MFPEQLKALRKGSGYTLSQLANELNKLELDDQLNVHPNSGPQIGSWERGINTPSYYEVMKLAIFFDVSMDFIVGRINQQIDIEKIFAANNNLIFDGKHLSGKERAESYNLLKGYFVGKEIKMGQRQSELNSREYKEISFRLGEKK
ncbi:helix-turn-helix domain-containing protein [Liquorilactobacillus cacaonum]|uniref:Cro CI family transcriptional regulator n=1 Tax=Liquorilactobacillus cacaonum DSM 21116 TaxID=1423729 RepID=A0A0R2CDX5_9LACO|nr:helix-turn-helix transcriptional regulator [Liquorilactobacillus cacaonum]KRM89937.1 Cro CI family transcriptional regulator [Liquorilactobacillus cacaonum DSM 21116]